MQWVAQQRLHCAAHLLMTTGLPIGEIGCRVGMDDPYHFSKWFTRHQQMTPTAFRKAMSMFPHSGQR